MSSPNQDIIELLKELAEVKRTKGDIYRSSAYLRAVRSLQGLESRIQPGQSIRLPNIGPSISNKIDEYLSTGKIAELEKERDDLNYHIRKEFANVYGFGTKQINELIKHGYKDVDSLKSAVNRGKIILTERQKIGLKYFDDLKLRIPRTEMDTWNRVLCNAVESVAIDRHITLCGELAGSYRRKKETSGDIDLLIYSNEIKTRDDFARDTLKHGTSILQNIVTKLKELGYMIDDLTEQKGVKYMGIIRLPNYPARHIDILFCPMEEYPYALLYFTGSGEFNKKMRMVAKDKGYKLSEKELYDNNAKKKLIVKSERQIFDKLDMPYREPHMRE